MADANIGRQRWQDWVNLLLGIWLFLSPWIFGFFHDAHSWNFWIIGAAFFVFGVAALNTRQLWEEWVNLVLGVWMIISPWVTGYSRTISARDDAVIVGIVVAVLSIWALLLRNQTAAVGGIEHPASH
jgi:hypothetical protein